MKKCRNNLRALRKAKGFKTLQALADKTGVPLSSISAFENATKPMSDEYIESIENVLGEKIVEEAENFTPGMVCEENGIPYGSAAGVWSAVPTDQLEQLLATCEKERDWMAVEKVARELANRKMKERMGI
jgi:transcriptional regulator with XRE-family HTH domain